jgi:UPF0755 protein
LLRIVLQSLKIVTIAVVAVLVVAGGFRFFDYYMDKTAAENIGDPVTFTIKKDESVDSVAKRLHDEGLIRYEPVFTTLVRVANADVVPKTYHLRIGMSQEQIVDIVTGKKKDEPAPKKEAKPKTLKLTVPEGWRTEQIAEELVKIGWNGSVDDFMKAVKAYNVSDLAFLKDRDNPVNPDSLEGYLFPDTYQVTSDEPAGDIIQTMLMNFDSKFTPEMRKRADEMGLSTYQVLIFSSLVEREAKVGRERPIIADVYLNRYEQGWNLEADPTVRYGIGKDKSGDWWAAPSKDDLQDEGNPYNTYKHGGLPPGPICNPGLASIQAVLTPGGTNYLFFVATGDQAGDHLFAVDKASQDQNVAYLDGKVDSPAPGSNPFEGQGGGATDTSGSGENVPIQSTGG